MVFRVAIIGAGPSGLVTLKYLLAAENRIGCEEIEPRLFESAGDVGGTFAHRAYEDAELVSSRQLTTFSDFRRPDQGDFMSTRDYAQYLRDYCTYFDLWPHINLCAKVCSVARHSKGHKIFYQSLNIAFEWDCDAVAICSGLHVEPNQPTIPGIEHVPRVMHSSEFKGRYQFDSSRTVMVVGAGETGADISYLAVTTPNVENVILCHKNGFHFAPKRNPGPTLLPILGRKPDPAAPGIPIDISRANLFDTSYVHAYLKRNDTWLWIYYTFYVMGLLFLSSGTWHGFDQWVGEVRPLSRPSSRRDAWARKHQILFNKSNKACAYISYPYRPYRPGPAFWHYALRSALVQTPVPDTKGRQIDLAPLPRQINPDRTVNFINNGRPEYVRLQNKKIVVDMIVFCTGYRESFPFLGATYPTSSAADMRGVWKQADPSVGFIGFVRPSLGAIPPLAEMQAQLWITNLLAPIKIPKPLQIEDQSHYKLFHEANARIIYAVDHESYAYQLALDMAAAPGLLDMLQFCHWNRPRYSSRLLLIWALGANFNTKFRLQGPWKLEGAADLLASGEFWQTIRRRPMLFGHFAVSILPILIFGPVNLGCYLWFSLLHVSTPALAARN